MQEDQAQRIFGVIEPSYGTYGYFPLFVVRTGKQDVYPSISYKSQQDARESMNTHGIGKNINDEAHQEGQQKGIRGFKVNRQLQEEYQINVRVDIAHEV